MSDPVIPFYLSVSGDSPVELSNTVWRKDAIRVGRFVARNPIDGTDLRLDVTPNRLAKWVESFSQMKTNGVSVDLTIDHKRGAEAKRGTVTGMHIVGDRLMFDATPADEASQTLMARCPEVSVEIEPAFRDGEGREYGEAITAISICRKPVVPGQQPFERIAASRTSGDSNTTQPPLLMFSCNTPAHNKTPNEESTDMLTKEQIVKAKKTLGLDDKATDAQVAQKIMLSLDSAVQLAETKTKLDESEGVRKKLSGDLEALKLKSEPIKLSREVEVLSKRALSSDLNALVESACITPAVRDKLLPELSKPIMLSIPDGSDQPNFSVIVDALKGNKAAELATLLGEKTGSQTVNLSRQTPGDDAAGNVLVADAQSRAKAAS